MKRVATEESTASGERALHTECKPTSAWATRSELWRSRVERASLRLADIAADKIYHAIVHRAGIEGKPVVRALLDPYNPAGVTDHVAFITTKTRLWATAEDKSHVNYVVGDADWELEFARVVEGHPPDALSLRRPQGRTATRRRETPQKQNPKRQLMQGALRISPGVHSSSKMSDICVPIMH